MGIGAIRKYYFCVYGSLSALYSNLVANDASSHLVRMSLAAHLLKLSPIYKQDHASISTLSLDHQQYMGCVGGCPVRSTFKKGGKKKRKE